MIERHRSIKSGAYDAHEYASSTNHVQRPTKKHICSKGCVRWHPKCITSSMEFYVFSCADSGSHQKIPIDTQCLYTENTGCLAKHMSIRFRTKRVSMQ